VRPDPPGGPLQSGHRARCMRSACHLVYLTVTKRTAWHPLWPAVKQLAAASAAGADQMFYSARNDDRASSIVLRFAALIRVLIWAWVVRKNFRLAAQMSAWPGASVHATI